MVIEAVRQRLPALVSVIGLLFAWQVLAMTFFANAHMLPGPIELARGLWSDWDYYPPNIAATASVALKGYLAGNLVAICLALACILIPRSEGPIMQIAVAAYAVPLLAIAPILVVVCQGDTARVIVASLSVFFTTLVGAHAGLRQADPASLQMVSAYGGGRFALLVKVRFWSCLPSLFAALKIAGPSALLGAMIAEFLGADSGLGIGLVISEQNLDGVRTLGIAAVTTAMAGLAYGLVGFIGHWATSWLRHEADRK
jgi:ABC-type nitrate/sulfonate/bicarbonate transport system permease component